MVNPQSRPVVGRPTRKVTYETSRQDSSLNPAKRLRSATVHKEKENLVLNEFSPPPRESKSSIPPRKSRSSQIRATHASPANQLKSISRRKIIGLAHTNNRSQVDANNDVRSSLGTRSHRLNGDLSHTLNGLQKPWRGRLDETASDSSVPQSMDSNKLIAPKPVTLSEGSRKLRSQDEGAKLKSELTIYFPNYDEFINDVPKEPDFLDYNDKIYIVNDPIKSSKPQNHTPQTRPPLKASSKPNDDPTTRTSNKVSQASQSPGFQRLDLKSVNRAMAHGQMDSLQDSLYLKPHRRAERKEKQLRNIEKERAMHEKSQLERLLEGLRGPDWLKVMGITGITDSEKSKYESKRDHFIKEVRALVDKFRRWKEEERKQKTDRDIREKVSASVDHMSLNGDGPSARPKRKLAEVDNNGLSLNEFIEKPPGSDDDDWASRQLLQEANSANSPHKILQEGFDKSPAILTGQEKSRAHANILPQRKASGRRESTSKPVAQPPQEEIVRPFTSFFQKPYQRAAALGQNRHGRGNMAFGHAIPEVEEQEFKLPPELDTPDFRKAHARKRRRLQRDSVNGERRV